MHHFLSFLRSLSANERRNAIFYIIGLMCYKFAFDSVLHSFQKAIDGRSKESKNTTWATVLSMNILMQCFGSLMVSPLVYRFSPQRLLPCAVIVFATIVITFPMLYHLWLDNAFSGKEQDKLVYLLGALYAMAGFSQGVVELVRRVIPERIVGNSTDRLKYFDSMVHLCYEVAGVTGAFSCHAIMNAASSLRDSGLFLFPCLALPCALLWSNVRVYSIEESSSSSAAEKKQESAKKAKMSRNFLVELKSVFCSFATSVRNGFFLVLCNRSLIWLIPAYSLPLLLHRYFEGVLLKQYALIRFGDANLRLKLVAGSNLGEFFGALLVIIFSGVRSPLPWLRIDGLTLFLTWCLTIGRNVTSASDGVPGAHMLAAAILLCSSVSLGFASGDVTLNAYIQSRLAGVSGGSSRTSPLGSVMAFLYVSYIILFAVFSIGMNLYADAKGPDFLGTAITYTCIAYSICGVIVLLATLIPRGAIAFNPSLRVEDDVPIKFPRALSAASKDTRENEAAEPRQLQGPMNDPAMAEEIERDLDMQEEKERARARALNSTPNTQE